MSDRISLVVVDQEPRVDSRVIAGQLGVEHKNTRALIQQYQSDLEEFGLLPFETEAVKNERARGTKYEKYALLNEDQSYLVLTYAQNTPQARELKKRLVRSFSEHRQAALPHPQPPANTTALAAQLAALLQDKVLVDYSTLVELANIPFAMRHLIGLVESYAAQLEAQIGKPLINRSGEVGTEPEPEPAKKSEPVSEPVKEPEPARKPYCWELTYAERKAIGMQPL